MAERKPSWGLGKMMDYLKQQNKPWNHKLIRRVYCALHLYLTVKSKRRLPKRSWEPLAAPDALNQSWSLDFVRDSLVNGRPFQTLNIIDGLNREAIHIEVAVSLPAIRVIQVLNGIITLRSCPRQIRMDNGPELISKDLDY